MVCSVRRVIGHTERAQLACRDMRGRSSQCMRHSAISVPALSFRSRSVCTARQSCGSVTATLIQQLIIADTANPMCLPLLLLLYTPITLLSLNTRSLLEPMVLLVYKLLLYKMLILSVPVTVIGSVALAVTACLIQVSGEPLPVVHPALPQEAQVDGFHRRRRVHCVCQPQHDSHRRCTERLRAVWWCGPQLEGVWLQWSHRSTKGRRG